MRKVVELMERDRILPRLPLPKFIRRRLRLPDTVSYRVRLLAGLAQTGFLILFATIAVGLGISALISASVREPPNRKEVIERVGEPQELSWTVETVRAKEISGQVLRIDTLRAMAVDQRTRAFQAEIHGLSPIGVVKIRGDGKKAAVRDQRGTFELNRYPALSTVRPLQASDLKSTVGAIVDDKFTANNTRAWLLDWRPRNQDLLRVLGDGFLGDEAQQDLPAIRDGRYKVRSGRIVVLRKGNKLFQADIVIEVNGALLRILVNFLRDGDDVLDDTTL